MGGWKGSATGGGAGCAVFVGAGAGSALGGGVGVFSIGFGGWLPRPFAWLPGLPFCCGYAETEVLLDGIVCVVSPDVAGVW